MLMVSTITPATAGQDLLETAVRLVRMLFVINSLYHLIDILSFTFSLICRGCVLFVFFLVRVRRIAAQTGYIGLQKRIYDTKHTFVLFFVLMFPKKGSKVCYQSSNVY